MPAMVTFFEDEVAKDDWAAACLSLRASVPWRALSTMPRSL
jgi:hypothetical protein